MNMCFNMRQNVRLLNVQSEAGYRHQSEDPPPDIDTVPQIAIQDWFVP